MRQSKIKSTLEIANSYAQIDGSHHKMWVIDQMIRCLLGDSYEKWIKNARRGPNGENEYYEWDEGTAP